MQSNLILPGEDNDMVMRCNRCSVHLKFSTINKHQCMQFEFVGNNFTDVKNHRKVHNVSNEVMDRLDWERVYAYQKVELDDFKVDSESLMAAIPMPHAHQLESSAHDDLFRKLSLPQETSEVMGGHRHVRFNSMPHQSQQAFSPPPLEHEGLAHQQSSLATTLHSINSISSADTLPRSFSHLQLIKNPHSPTEPVNHQPQADPKLRTTRLNSAPIPPPRKNSQQSTANESARSLSVETSHTAPFVYNTNSTPTNTAFECAAVNKYSPSGECTKRHGTVIENGFDLSTVLFDTIVPCYTCDDLIDTKADKHLEAAGHCYHLACFRCHLCGRIMGYQEPFWKDLSSTLCVNGESSDGLIMCQRDFERLTSNKGPLSRI